MKFDIMRCHVLIGNNLRIIYLHGLDLLLVLDGSLLAVDLAQELRGALGLVRGLAVDGPDLEDGLHHLGLDDARHELHLALHRQLPVLRLLDVLAQSLECILGSQQRLKKLHDPTSTTVEYDCSM